MIVVIKERHRSGGPIEGVNLSLHVSRDECGGHVPHQIRSTWDDYGFCSRTDDLVVLHLFEYAFVPQML